MTATIPAVEDLYPLSPTQQGLLFHSLYGPDSGVYVVQMGFTVRGTLNLETFCQAWQGLVQRHPVLRTAFTWESLAEPLQVVGRQATLPISIHDWQAKSPPEQTQALTDWLACDRRQGFDLSAAPLMRLTILQLAPDSYRVIWTYHHLLLDGWSVPLVLQELLVSYQALERGQTPALGTPRPYRNYIAWLKQQDMAAAKQFWQHRFQGLSAPTPLGIDRPRQRAAASPAQYAVQHRCLSSELTDALRSHAQTHRLTLNTLVQGAWALVLGRYSGDPEVLFGSTCAGRPPTLPGAETMIGLFINTLPLRVSLAPEQSVQKWLQQLQNQQLDQQPYEYTPLVQIHGSSNIPRSLPLFESVVVFENYPVEPALKQGVHDLAIEDVSTAEQTNYPLTLFAIANHTLELKVQYDCDRLMADAIERLLGHLETVLAGFVTHAQSALGRIPLLTSTEQQELQSWNQTAQPIPDRCVHELIADQANANPNANALIFEDISLSYQELDQRANQRAHYLIQQGVQRGDRVALCLERSAELVITLLAILKAGATYLPLDPTYPMERLRFILEDAQVSLLITAHGATNAIPQTAVPTLDLNRKAEAIALAPLPPDSHSPTSHDLAYLIYTSGSTGIPKGVPIRHRSLTNLLTSMAQAPGMTAADKLLAVTTPAFDIAALELFLPLTVGGTLVIASQEAVRDPQQLATQLEHHDVTLMQATPATWRLLLESGWQGKANLKLLCGGEALELALAQQLLNSGAELWNLYGPTETTIWSAALRLDTSILADGLVPTGPPIANTQFHVLDAQQRSLPIGVPGELHIGGLGLSPGYWQREDLTAERFVANPFSAVGADGGTSDAESWSHHPGLALDAEPCAPTGSVLYKTGDRVRTREDGTLEYLGRLDHQVKLRGFRIELGEIEAVLAQHPDVSQSIVVLREDNTGEPQLIAYVTQAEGHREQGTGTREQGEPRTQNLEPSNQGQIIKGTVPETMLAERSRSPLPHFLSQHLPAYMVPTQFVLLDALPLTPNGKVDRNALPTPGSSPHSEPLALPRTQVEKAIAVIWQTVLNQEQVGLHDNFFDLGGHSLLMVRVHGQLQQQLAVEIPLVELFRYPTVNALAAHLRSRSSEGQVSDRAPELAAGKQRLQQRRQQRHRQPQQPAGGRQHG